ELESQLLKRDPDFVRQSTARSASYKELAAQLPADLALVELVPEAGDAASACYEIYVLRKGPDDLPLLRRLRGSGVAAKRAAAEAWRAAVARGGELKGEDRQVRRLLWEPALPHLGGCAQVLLAVDAPLAQAPWSALPGAQAGEWESERLTISVVPDAAL